VAAAESSARKRGNAVGLTSILGRGQFFLVLFVAYRYFVMFWTSDIKSIWIRRLLAVDSMQCA